MTIAIALAPTYPRREIIFALFATRTNKNKFSLQRRGDERRSSKLELAKKGGNAFFPHSTRRRQASQRQRGKNVLIKKKCFCRRDRPTPRARGGGGVSLYDSRFASLLPGTGTGRIHVRQPMFAYGTPPHQGKILPLPHGISLMCRISSLAMCRMKHLAKKKLGLAFWRIFKHLHCQFVEKREIIKLAIWQSGHLGRIFFDLCKVSVFRVCCIHKI